MNRTTDNRDMAEIERFDKARIEALLNRIQELKALVADYEHNRLTVEQDWMEQNWV